MAPPALAACTRSSPYIGRSSELDRLVEAVRHPPGTVLIEGEAGIGKSRLIRELLRHSAMADQVVLRGVCPPMREPLAYGPVIEALRHGRERLNAKERLKGTEWGPRVGPPRAFLPELSAVLSGQRRISLEPVEPDQSAEPDASSPPAQATRADAPLRPAQAAEADALALPAQVAPAVQRHELFPAFRALLAAHGPAVLVIEDVHWADSETWDLLLYLCADPPPEMVLVLTCRRPCGALPAHYSALNVSTRMRLAPLDAPQVGRLAAHVLGVPQVPQDFAATLHLHTGGIPLWVEEAMRDVPAPESATLQPALLADLPAPPGLHDAMRELLASAGRAASAAIRAAAILGEPATEQDLGAVAGLPARRTGAAVTRAVEIGALYEVGPGRYGMRHFLAAQAVRETTPGPQRWRLHARAAELLATKSDRKPDRLAHHYRQSGNLAAWVQHTLAAVEQKLATADATAAIALLERVLADTELPDSAHDLFVVRLSRAVLNGITPAETIDRLRAALHHDRLSPAARGEVHLNLGRWLINQAGQLEAGQSEIEAAVTELREQPELAARGMAALALPSLGTGPVETHLHWLRQAEAALGDSVDAETIAAVLTNRLSVRMQTADPKVWEDIAELAQILPSKPQLARAYFNLADAATWNGHYGRAYVFLMEGKRLTSENEGEFLSMLGDGTSLRLDAASGQWAHLSRAADRVIALAGDMEFLAADAWLATGWLSLWQGARAAAAHHFDTALRTAPHNVPVVASARAGRTAMLLAQGRTAAACHEADLAIECLRDKGNWVWAAELVPVGIRVLARCGRMADAVELLQQFEDGLTGKDAPLATAAVDAGHGALALARGSASTAAAHYVQAALHYRQLPHPAEAARAHESAAHCFSHTGEHEAAANQFTAALALYAMLGTIHDVARCQRHVRSYEGAGKRGRKGYGQELSPREREVAMLAGQGMTNHQIAEMLVLSPRTVEQHVARALRKLNLNSRTAFADQLPEPRHAGRTLR
ncbi:ATP-binding protein [Streptomyces zagrosensis]|uniref:DNA-binding CsgD family transcriptional regulator/Tfp pilus assembly protein PilF n=1 Tax=Streptomyces zagrosensis TaxID=1042984 RepID=A0A7W9Q838_9ACTN|nr:LuxR family transcriptional regulator [Streptomyces zagrosensis]MBB5934297.1 DNA-binding CsgD family transcriptional regulator/Tfp pilus assembly protein PilF [Streptomyces zagrosensis]